MGNLLANNMGSIVVGLIALASAVWVAKITRSGSKEANTTTSWTNLVASLEKRNAELETRLDQEEKTNAARFTELDQNNRQLARDMFKLKDMVTTWHIWARRSIAIGKMNGIVLPPTPESLGDTDPRMEKI